MNDNYRKFNTLLFVAQQKTTPTVLQLIINRTRTHFELLSLFFSLVFRDMKSGNKKADDKSKFSAAAVTFFIFIHEHPKKNPEKESEIRLEIL